MPSLPRITQALLIANVAIFIVGGLLGDWFIRAFGLWPWGYGFMPWQPVTYAFLHGDFLHLAFNMLGLWMFGGELERVWGEKRFVHFYSASVLSAAVCQLVVVALIGSVAPTVGASGGLFGLLLGYGMTFPNRMITPLFPPIPMRAKVFVAVFGGIELLLGSRILDVVFGTPIFSSNIAHFAHLGGMLGGYLMIQYWYGRPPFRRSGRR